MDALIFPIVDALSFLTVAGDVIVLVVLIALLTKMQRVTAFVTHHGLLLMLIVAVIGTGGSLFLSEIAGWTPCKLCWLQRIFLYPQVVLLAIALWKKDRNIAVYVLALSVIGAVIAVYHYWEQIHATFFLPPGTELEPCDGSGVSCARTYTFRLGYITIPMMALTAFLLNTLGAICMLRRSR